MNDCPSCGETVGDANFCPECGFELNRCPGCHDIVPPDSDFCNSCGASLSDKISQSDSDKKSERRNPNTELPGEPNPKVGTVRGLLGGIIPGFDNSSYVKNLIGGCPNCGEGQDLNVESNTGLLDYHPLKSITDYDIQCNRCGTKLESEGRWMRAVGSNELIDNKKLAPNETIRLSKYRRQDNDSKYTNLAEQITDKKEADKNTDKLFSISSKLYYYPVAIIIFLFGIVAISQSGRISDIFVIGILAGLALPPVRNKIGEAVGISLPWWGKTIIAVLYGILAFFMFLGLLFFPAM